MACFMLYYLANQVFQFLLVGSTYLAINNLMHDVIVKKWQIFNEDSVVEGMIGEDLTLYMREGGVSKMFTYMYFGMLMFIMMLSVGGVLSKAMFYFKSLLVFLTFWTFVGLIGMTYLISETGFKGKYNEDINKDTGCQNYDADNNEWVRVGKKKDLSRYNFMWTSLFGVIILCAFFVPILLRPMDFIKNIHRYIVGFCTYMVLLPTYTNTLQIYAMCNLHDISWGNRPTTAGGATGQNQLTSDQQKQLKLKNEYMLFRVQFLLFWIVSNVIYISMVQDIFKANSQERYCGNWSFVDCFTCFLTCISIFKIFFASCHYLTWKFRAFDKRYQCERFDLDKESKTLRSNLNNESVMELMTAEQFLQQKSAEEDQKEFEDDRLLANTTKKQLNAKKLAINKKKRLEGNENHSKFINEDDDEFEFVDAIEEEKQDLQN